MKPRLLAVAAVFAGAVSLGWNGGLQAQGATDTYLGWTAKQAEAVGKAAYQRGRVGGIFDTRLLKTERSYNYKLAATWLTPDVIRATARLQQLRSRLSDAQTRALVAEAEAAQLMLGAGGTTIRWLPRAATSQHGDHYRLQTAHPRCSPIKSAPSSTRWRS